VSQKAELLRLVAAKDAEIGYSGAVKRPSNYWDSIAAAMNRCKTDVIACHSHSQNREKSKRLKLGPFSEEEVSYLSSEQGAFLPAICGQLVPITL
jgi:hypothetical protein